MNPMTNIKNIQKLSKSDIARGAWSKGSWHDEYRDSAWIFFGGMPYALTEGDIVCIFSQYGEIIQFNLIRDKETGKSRGFGFLCYEDQRSTDLAVDNFNGTKIMNRTIRVDHVKEYKVPKHIDKMDQETLEVVEKGIAPKLKDSDEEVLELPPVKKAKKEKHKKMKKKKRKRSKSSESLGGSSDEGRKPSSKKRGESPDSERGAPMRRKRDGSTPPRRKRDGSTPSRPKRDSSSTPPRRKRDGSSSPRRKRDSISTSPRRNREGSTPPRRKRDSNAPSRLKRDGGTPSKRSRDRSPSSGVKSPPRGKLKDTAEGTRLSHKEYPREERDRDYGRGARDRSRTPKRDRKDEGSRTKDRGEGSSKKDERTRDMEIVSSDRRRSRSLDRRERERRQERRSRSRDRYR